jgi:cellobiose phosphorylase
MGESERAWELFALLNPIHHSGTPTQIATYKVEPYVVAADVYAVAPHTGRGGWTWYTGSAGWMYRLLIETLLGVHLEGDQLRLNPRLPKSWTTCKLFLDGKELALEAIPLVDDRHEHFVELKVWSPVSIPENQNLLLTAV